MSFLQYGICIQKKMEVFKKVSIVTLSRDRNRASALHQKLSANGAAATAVEFARFHSTSLWRCVRTAAINVKLNTCAQHPSNLERATAAAQILIGSRDWLDAVSAFSLTLDAAAKRRGAKSDVLLDFADSTAVAALTLDSRSRLYSTNKNYHV
jgi:hypothetical protein